MPLQRHRTMNCDGTASRVLLSREFPPRFCFRSFRFTHDRLSQRGLCRLQIFGHLNVRDVDCTGDLVESELLTRPRATGLSPRNKGRPSRSRRALSYSTRFMRRIVERPFPWPSELPPRRSRATRLAKQLPILERRCRNRFRRHLAAVTNSIMHANHHVQRISRCPRSSPGRVTAVEPQAPFARRVVVTFPTMCL